MRKRKESNRRVFVENIDSQSDLVHELLHKKIKKEIENKSVLDVGCWTGQLIWYAKDLAKEIIGIDPGVEAIKFAKEKYKDYKNIKFICSTAEEFSIKNKKFDVVVMTEVIEHLPVGTESEVISKINKLLKKNGKFILSTPHKNLFSIILDPAYFLIGHRHYSNSELIFLLERNGFKINKIEYFGGFVHMLSSNFLLIFKHLFKIKLTKPLFIRNIIRWEFDKGFVGIIVYSQKNRKV